MANQLLFTLGRELDANGNTVSGAKAYFYEAGTTTPITAYQDNATVTPHAWPQVSDGGGLFSTAYIAGSSAKVVITKSDGSALRTIDPCPVISVGGVGASGISFSPTVDIPETNVQDAIETAAATAASGFAAFGLGVTGNAPTLADIDATNIGVGFYRTTAASTGTFPTGITASSTSIVRLERETSALAVMTLLDDGGKVFQRFMIASSWGAWRHIVTMPVSPTTGDIVNWNGSAWAGITPSAAGQVPTWTGSANAYTQKLTELSTSATTSGTTVDFTGIPSWARRVTMYFRSVSGSGTNYLGVRVGHSGAYLTTGYTSGHGDFTDAGASDTNYNSDRFGLSGDLSIGSDAYSGTVVLVKYGTFWHFDAKGMTYSGSGTPNVNAGAGWIDMGANTLDRVRALWSGADTFDAGNICVMYE